MPRKHGKRDFPLVNPAALLDYVVEQTGVDRRIAHKVIEAYNKAIYDTLVSGIQVALPNVGTLTFRVHEPRPEGIYWNGFQKQYMPYPNRQGYYRLDVMPYVNFAGKLKANTTFGEEPTLDEYNEALIARHGDRAKPRESL